MSGRAAFQVCLLGPPVVMHRGTTLRVETRKAIALLARLAVERRSHARAQVRTVYAGVDAAKPVRRGAHAKNQE
ncbi:MAG: hypothetical protein EA426_18940 [Spirochaetaceae bacterium]|nr:MAG: hypothetical protein EA426_18940 [Spirochaetaceae bacterium]